MNGTEFHQKYLRANLNFHKLIEAVYDGDIKELDEKEINVVAANAALMIKEATKKFVHKLKLCIVCGTPHKHNNSFCSAEHAEVYEMQKKANRGPGKGPIFKE
jgi:hypothetical protein